MSEKLKLFEKLNNAIIIENNKWALFKMKQQYLKKRV